MDRRDEFSGTVKVLFQPAEEGGGGAKVMIDEGVMDDPKVDAVFGLHMDQDSPVGTIGWVAGPAGAASDRFDLTIQGRGGHGARPSRCIDPIVVGSEIIVALQTIVSREINPILPGRHHHRLVPCRRSPERDPGHRGDAGHGPLVRPRGARVAPNSGSPRSSRASPRPCEPRSTCATSSATRP